jgi:hypothetical protein
MGLHGFINIRSETIKRKKIGVMMAEKPKQKK